MQLKIKRSQRTGGMLGSKVIFCLDARVQYDATERANIRRYKLQNEAVYSSQAARRNHGKADAHMDGTNRGNLKSIAYRLMTLANLTITVGSLERGHHIECKDINELLEAEEALIAACSNVKIYLQTAATFDGLETLIDFSGDEPIVTAQASSPDPMPVEPTPPASPADPPDTEDGEPWDEPIERERTDTREWIRAFGIEPPDWMTDELIRRWLIGGGALLGFVLLLRSCS